ncbi:MAG: aspartate-semialdehyde dehydrogenase [Acidobacteria bacterium]|nr:aspartate-semialdehyde dehydrogenase [Acidobacteriota bacterium]
MERMKVAVLGATGVVGQRIVAMLDRHPWFEVTALAASEGSVGAPYGQAVRGRWHAPGEVPEWAAGLPVVRCVPGVDARITFCALDANVAGPIEEAFARAGYLVSSNAKNHRMSRSVPLVIPEVNPEHLSLLAMQGYGPGGIVTNPNCSTTGIALALAPLHKRFGVSRVVVTTMQSLSGAGYPGVPALAIAGNVIPYIEGEEEKIEKETVKILGNGDRPAGFRISAQCNRVGTTVGHLATLAVELERKTSYEEIADAFTEFRPLTAHDLPTAPAAPIALHDDPSRPQPALDVDRGRGMVLTIGKLRPDPVFDWRFTLLVNNLVRGAAGAAILNAELLVQQGLAT